MKTTTTIEKVSATTIISKSFTTKSPKNGHEIVVTVYRREREIVGSFKSPIYFGVSFNGEQFGHNDMDRESLTQAIETIDKWGQFIVEKDREIWGI